MSIKIIVQLKNQKGQAAFKLEPYLSPQKPGDLHTPLLLVAS